MAELIPHEIMETPAAIQATIAETRKSAQEAAGLIRDRHPERIFLVGNGTSLYSSLAAAYTARALAGKNDPYVLALPAGEFRYYMPALKPSDVIIGVSASGEFRDVLKIFDQVRNQNLCVGISHVPDSSITRIAAITLLSGGGPSRVPVMTKTYASTLTAAHLLLLETLGAGAEVYKALAETADLVQACLDTNYAYIGDLSAQIARLEHAFYFGAGPAYATALEGALKMKEMALLHAEGSETWEMASGPATMVGEKTLTVALYAGDTSDVATADGAKHAKQWGAPVLEVGPQAYTDGWHIRVPVSNFSPFATLSLVPPLALLAFRVARLHGLNPDRPNWSERYRSQGMSHILGE
jgi:glucosamine--fructose-6-phosphate aminotransferase (isomerizing)